jgi:hypothetical protein
MIFGPVHHRAFLLSYFCDMPIIKYNDFEAIFDQTLFLYEGDRVEVSGLLEGLTVVFQIDKMEDAHRPYLSVTSEEGKLFVKVSPEAHDVLLIKQRVGPLLPIIARDFTETVTTNIRLQCFLDSDSIDGWEVLYKLHVKLLREVKNNA